MRWSEHGEYNYFLSHDIRCGAVYIQSFYVATFTLSIIIMYCICVLILINAHITSPPPEVHIREDSQKFVQATESGDSKRMRRTLQLVRGRSLQLIRMVREDVTENSAAYSPEQLPRLEASLQALGEKGERNNYGGKYLFSV